MRTPVGSCCGKGVVTVPVVTVPVVTVPVVTVVVPVVVVPVVPVVVSATTAADIVPAKPNPSTKRTANPIRLTREV
jgi:hypothetical protein